MLLDEEQIARRRIPLEEAEISVSRKSNWHCSYCNKRWGGETAFMNHRCEPKRRAEEFASPLGQAAYGFYREWLRLKKHSAQGAEAFKESKYYRAFIKFAELVAKAGISFPEKYIELMVEGEVLPVLWCRDACYTLYLEWVERRVDPMEQVEKSAALLFDLAEREEVSHTAIIEHLGPQRIFELLHQHRLTPWLLLRTAGFKRLFATFDNSQKKVFGELVNTGYWSQKFSERPEVVAQVNELVKELGL